jgi:serine/threonine-protein kinase
VTTTESGDAEGDRIAAPPVAADVPPRLRVPLAWRIFLGSAGVVAVVLGGALLLTAREAERAATASAARGVAALREQAVTRLEGRARALLDGARVFAQGPNFRSLVATGVREDALDQAREAVERLAVSWVQITDGNGVRLARTDMPDAPPESLGGQALIRRALAGEAVAAYGLAGDTMPIQAVAIRIEGATPGRPAGTLMATRQLDAGVARAMATSVEGDVVFYVLPRSGPARLAASTLPPSPELLRAVTALAEVAEPPAAAAPDSQPGAPAPAAAPAGVELGGERYLALAAPLRSADGRAVAGVAVLRSRSAELSPFLALERTILLAGVAGLGLALLVSFAIARQITRPLAGLVTAVRRAAAGDYSGDIEVRSRDEIGTLAAAFHAMLEDLREKQVLVEFARLAPGRGGRPSPAISSPGVSSGSGPRFGRQADRRAPLARRVADHTAPVRRADVGAADVTPTGTASAEAAVGDDTPPNHAGGTNGPPVLALVDAIAAASALRPGQRFAGRYDIRHMIGAGGGGVVFLATDVERGEPVALKVLRPDLLQQDDTAIARLAREVEIARRLEHPNIVRVYALGESEGLHFITMEFAEGSTLRHLIDTRGTLPIPVVLSLAKQLCRALEHAHERGVIHRDIKPHNLVVTPDGTLKVMDFGTARLTEAPRGLTESGVLFGTPAYMAPEALRGATVDARADVYAAGVVLYEALVGRTPFTSGAGSPLVVLTHVLESAPTDPAQLNQAVPRALADAVLDALSKDPARRPASARALAERLAAAGERPAAAAS